MLTSTDVAELLTRRGARGVTTQADHLNSVSSGVVRAVLGGRLAVGVGSDHLHPVSAFTDLVDLHLRGWAPPTATVTVRDEIDFYLAARASDRETPVALRTLSAALPTTKARVFTLDPHGEPTRLGRGAPSFADASEHGYAGWLDLLDAIPSAPPTLVTTLIETAGLPALRAYPMLSSRGKRWSIRLEGLQVGVISAEGGYLGVGRDSSDGRRSAKRLAWVSIAGPEPIRVTAVNVVESADLLGRFAARWTTSATGGDRAIQDEHALESRILRGDVQLTPAGGRTLTLLNPRGDTVPTPDPVVSWGSQFPTRWGPRAGAARYLDGLLRDGTTPWAVELKVRGPGGVGQYYRHAVHQAVLYREFIRTATPLRPWFRRHGLDQSTCRAAVVVPEEVGPAAHQVEKVRKVAAVFDVQLITVNERDAHLHTPAHSPGSGSHLARS